MINRARKLLREYCAPGFLMPFMTGPKSSFQHGSHTLGIGLRKKLGKSGELHDPGGVLTEEQQSAGFGQEARGAVLREQEMSGTQPKGQETTEVQPDEQEAEVQPERQEAESNQTSKRQSQQKRKKAEVQPDKRQQSQANEQVAEDLFRLELILVNTPEYSSGTDTTEFKTAEASSEEQVTAGTRPRESSELLSAKEDMVNWLWKKAQSFTKQFLKAFTRYLDRVLTKTVEILTDLMSTGEQDSANSGASADYKTAKRSSAELSSGDMEDGILGFCHCTFVLKGDFFKLLCQSCTSSSEVSLGDKEESNIAQCTLILKRDSFRLLCSSCARTEYTYDNQNSDGEEMEGAESVTQDQEQEQEGDSPEEQEQAQESIEEQSSDSPEDQNQQEAAGNDDWDPELANAIMYLDEKAWLAMTRQRNSE
nr:uncharacterized protein LOC113808475 [Penaeus vannamei]